ncbi:MAG: endonuclease/exonuclease/phosphatase family protein [Betaproteobacteria bacterium]|nr:MAG: endonuclease/exonuclease/phosphatase family protein [Betaproteobacteria bacterium]
MNRILDSSGIADQVFGKRLAPVYLAMAIAALLSIGPKIAFAEPGVVSVCEPPVMSNARQTEVIKVLSLNISHGRNTALNQLFVGEDRVYQNLDKIALLLNRVNPDVVALQEADAASRWSGNFDHVNYVSQQSDLPCRVHGLHSQTWISNYGTALLSRDRPTESTSVKFSPSWPSKQKGFVTATFEWPVGRQRISITVVSVHFDFLRARVRDQQVNELVEHLARVEGSLVLMGDLNSQWGDDKSHVRTLADKLELHAFSPEDEALGSYKSRSGKRFDWILISHDLEFRDYRTLPDVVADHFAVYAEIAYRKRQE